MEVFKHQTQRPQMCYCVPRWLFEAWDPLHGGSIKEERGGEHHRDVETVRQEKRSVTLQENWRDPQHSLDRSDFICCSFNFFTER